MSDRTYDIILSCGCAISLDGGGGLMPCSYDDNPNCKYFEEYLCSPNWVEWEVEKFARNWYEKEPTKEEREEVRRGAQKEYDERIKEAYASGRLDVLEGIVEWV